MLNVLNKKQLTVAAVLFGFTCSALAQGIGGGIGSNGNGNGDYGASGNQGGTNQQPTKVAPKTLDQIRATQDGYSFSQWKTQATCSFTDTQEKTTIKVVYDQTGPSPQFSAYYRIGADQNGTWSETSHDDGITQLVRKRLEGQSATDYLPLQYYQDEGYYRVFLQQGATGGELTRTIIVFPNGFYVSKNRSQYFVPGC